MIIDVTYFGYGSGLVMCGWLCGMIFSVVMQTLHRGSEII